MAAVQRVRTHATARRLERFNQSISNCNELEAIITAATRVEWLCFEPGRIIIADNAGNMLCKVWNGDFFDANPEYVQQDGPQITSPIAHRVGHYVIESVRPLKPEVRSHFMTVEAPE